MLNSFLMFLIWYSLFIVAFGLGFYIMLHTDTKTGSLFSSFSFYVRVAHSLPFLLLCHLCVCVCVSQPFSLSFYVCLSMRVFLSLLVCLPCLSPVCVSFPVYAFGVCVNVCDCVCARACEWCGVCVPLSISLFLFLCRQCFYLPLSVLKLLLSSCFYNNSFYDLSRNSCAS